jgi:type VI secretion system protein
MTLTLTVQNVDQLDNGGPTQLKLDRHGAVIGRSPHADWSLPDPKNYVSSTHCEIDYRDGQYILIDKSTNGTTLNGGTDRISGPQVLKDGDILGIGHYRVLARTPEGAAAAAATVGKAGGGAWGGWEGLPGSDSNASAPASPGWDPPEAAPPAAAGGWAPAPAPPTAATPASDWGSPPPSPSWSDPPPVSTPAPASSWGTPSPALAPSPGWEPSPPPASSPPGWAAAPSATPAADAWGAPAAATPAQSGWDAIRAGGQEAPAAADWDAAPASAISGRGPMSQSWSAPRTDGPAGPGWGAAASPDAEDVWGQFAASNAVDWARGFADPSPVAVAAPAGPNADAALWTAFAAGCGLSPGAVRTPPDEAAAKAGGLLRRLVSGLVVMLEARARAKAQLGAQSTTLELGGNNPLKFARGPEQALAQLLNPAERGFMDAEKAIEDSFQDLQAHQMATLQAMQGALRSTVERFSPEAIRARAETRGLLARILPSARNAALWDAYQREFEGVARGSDEAFLDVFAKAFKAAYEKAAHDMKKGI